MISNTTCPVPPATFFVASPSRDSIRFQAHKKIWRPKPNGRNGLGLYKKGIHVGQTVLTKAFGSRQSKLSAAVGVVFWGGKWVIYKIGKHVPLS